MPRVLIVDDHQHFRRVAAALLAAEGFDVVGEAADGESAVALTETLRPDLVLLDVQLPDLDGFEVARRVAQSVDPAPIILISSRSAADYGSRIASSGVLGFLRKEELSGPALKAILAPAA